MTITPPVSGGAPVSSYELNYRPVGSKANPDYMGNLRGEPIIVTGLSNGRPYEFRALAVNRGGRGPWSAYASVIPAPSPQGLLADFKFASRDPNRHNLVLGLDQVTGNRWLNLRKTDNTKTDISVQTLNWQTASSIDALPQFYGWDGHDWQLIPSLLPNASFYIYLSSDKQIFEFPVSTNVLSDSFRLGFGSTPRPTSIVAGTHIRILVADSGQADVINNWISGGNQPEVTETPAKPQPPALVASNGQVTVTITAPAQGGAPITTYELSYREVGSTGSHTHVPNLNTLSYTVMGLTNGRSYEFRVAAINRGGIGPWSNYASAAPQS